ncbi:uncharacterized protein B0P05DRAFT_480108 [Gilbertella persicaria]|uniref:uncharacterized protein n=1 Tax=Gilbertella persicaria TaxID=101096 RepID=UPI0022203DEC|nr:uncharacterized protein B0P05DRAFT_480108 [Gilbertella persicaria]KAI8051399.1 hypothetical protein B0P05DRAFT_480108 [Gilbertella persicaria]
MLDKELLEGLRQQTTLESQHLSSSVTLLLTSLNQANPDFYTYRSIIKRFNLPENERFDIFTHSDLNFVETMGNHFPSNPLLQPTLERTAAIHTTIALLNNLFLSANDKINFSWIEIETLLTQSTKWDGVGFRAGSDQKIGFCLVELNCSEYLDMKLYFELVFLVDNHLVRRAHTIVKLPTTPSQLKDFFNQTESLFTWKKSLIDSINNA